MTLWMELTRDLWRKEEMARWNRMEKTAAEAIEISARLLSMESFSATRLAQMVVITVEKAHIHVLWLISRGMNWNRTSAAASTNMIRRRVKGIDQSDRGSWKSLKLKSIFMWSPIRIDSMGFHPCYDC